MRKFGYIVLLTLVLAGCANRGIGPQGGPKDSIPPVPRFCEPELGALNYHGNKIEVTFDEYIQLDNIGTNLMMSPPQQNPPEVKARGKKLIVQFKDSLYDHTTYTLDFGSAVCDYREKVPLKVQLPSTLMLSVGLALPVMTIPTAVLISIWPDRWSTFAAGS